MIKQAYQSLPGPKAPAGLPLCSYCCCCCWRDPPRRKTPCGHRTAKSAVGSDPPAKVAENCRCLSMRTLGGLQQHCPAAVGGSVEPRPPRFWPPGSPGPRFWPPGSLGPRFWPPGSPGLRFWPPGSLGPRWPPAAGWSSLPAPVDMTPAESKKKKKRLSGRRKNISISLLN